MPTPNNTVTLMINGKLMGSGRITTSFLTCSPPPMTFQSRLAVR